MMGKAWPTWLPGSVKPADALAAAGAVVEEVSIPAVTFGLSAYYLIRRLRLRATWPAWTVSAYGLRVDAAARPMR